MLHCILPVRDEIHIYRYASGALLCWLWPQKGGELNIEITSLCENAGQSINKYGTRQNLLIDIVVLLVLLHLVSIPDNNGVQCRVGRRGGSGWWWWEGDEDEQTLVMLFN